MTAPCPASLLTDAGAIAMVATRDRIVFGNGGVDAGALHDESSVEGTTQELQIADARYTTSASGNDTGAAATVFAIDVETAPRVGNIATEKIVRIVQYAIAASNAEALLRCTDRIGGNVTPTPHADAPIQHGNAVRRPPRDGKERTTAPIRRGLERAQADSNDDIPATELDASPRAHDTEVTQSVSGATNEATTDYATIAPVMITLPAGRTNASTWITVRPVNDRTDEGKGAARVNSEHVRVFRGIVPEH